MSIEMFERVRSEFTVTTSLHCRHTMTRSLRGGIECRGAFFFRVHNAVEERDEYFRERADASGKLGASSLQKLTAALRMLAYGASYDSLDE